MFRKLYFSVVFLTSLVLLQKAHAQAAGAHFDLPDAPSAVLDQTTQSSGSAQQTTPQTTAPQTDDERRAKAQEQIQQQEHQRVLGVMASFNTTSNRDAVPMSPKQKFQLFFRSATDPWPFLLAGVVAGIGQADDSFPGYGQGWEGYGKRYGASFTDTFVGNFFGNAVLPTLLHQDPRYFQKGTGSHMSRFLWAATSTVWCKNDNGRWGPNYSNVVGNLIGSAISNVYYPQDERNVGDTIERGFTTSAEGIVGAEVNEFWPDLARYMKRKHQEKLDRDAAKQAARDAQAPQGTTPKN